jgi:hypothetical protein
MASFFISSAAKAETEAITMQVARRVAESLFISIPLKSF